jgi:DNA invertase Pin-like site-specific DNA recombinase
LEGAAFMKIAIYSRKSVYTGKGESIENQIDLCKSYCERILTYKDIEYIVYEDEGFSGKTINRPKFQQLLNDIKSKKIDVLICYRLDRISRSVADFSSTLELLQKHNVNFISIKEQFDTSTPMGRAMIYIASVFAQLERETIAERVKDNMLQLAKMGKWSGGQLPLGFSSEKVVFMSEEMKSKSFARLVPIPEELEIVKFIYKYTWL